MGKPLKIDAIAFEVIDDLPALVADAIKLVSNDGEDHTYVYPDHLGAPQKMTDKDRSVVWDASFLPFGEEDSLIGSAANDNRFPGQRLSSETGLHYNYVPDYDPTTGRYLQSDPIGLAGGINTYGYVSGNPVNYVDPKGLYLETGADLLFIGADLLFILNDNVLGSCDNLGENLTALGLDTLGALLPFVTGLGVTYRVGSKADDVLKILNSPKNSKRFSDEKQALVDMAKKDKKTGMTSDDMRAYKDLNKDLSDPFPTNKVRGPEVHSNRPHGKQPHGHVGPVDHIPIKDK